MDNNYINLRIRNFENHINLVLNDYSDLPLEVQRIVLDKAVATVTTAADIQTKKELAEYQKTNCDSQSSTCGDLGDCK